MSAISVQKTRRRLTTTELPDSALRLELRSGELVLWDNRVHRFESLNGERARIRSADSADLREVLVSELRGVPTLSVAELDQRLERRLITRYAASAQTTSLVAHLRGPKKSHREFLAAIAGIAPNPFWWGKLTPAEFVLILGDLTTWALTHFESVRSWSVAKEMTATEEQEGYGLIGRGQRMSTADYAEDRMTRSLRDIANPKVRGAALWTAHALMATCHVAASDRSSGKTTQDRQAALISGLAPASRQWLAQRQANWPSEYRRSTWINLNEGL